MTGTTSALSPERAVLRALLIDNQRLGAIDLAPSEFQCQAHRVIYNTILGIVNVGDVADIVTVAARLDETGELEGVGGRVYLAELTDDPSSPANIEHYAREVRKAHRRNDAKLRLIAATEQIENGEPIEAVLETLKPIGVERSKNPTFVRLADIDVSPPQWIVDGFLERESLSCIFGAPASFKSFLACDIAASVATGYRFRGLRSKQGAVIYIAGEGERGIRRRFRAWEIEHDQDLRSAPLYISTTPVPFGDSGSLLPALTELDRISRSQPIALIVIDTLSRNFHGDENSSADMPAFVSALDDIRSRFHATILVIHHTGHSATERSRGHSAFRAALDAEFKLERTSNEARLQPTKMKDAEMPEPMQWQTRVIDLDVNSDDEEPCTSCVLVPVGFVEPKSESKVRGKRQEEALAALEKLLPRQESARTRSRQKVLFDDWKAACVEAGITKQRFSDSKKAFLEKQIIAVEGNYVMWAT